MPKEKKQLFDWINESTSADSVIATTSLTDNIYLTVYTQANVFIPRSQHSLAPDSEALERLLYVYKISGISEDRLKAMFSLTESNKQVRAKEHFNFDDCAGHYIYFRRYIGRDYYNCSVPEFVLKDILQKYQSLNLNEINFRYRLDYWLWGPNEEKWATFIPENDTNWQLVWSNTAYRLYQFSQPASQ